MDIPVANADSHAEYLRDIGFNVTERDDGLLTIESNTTTDDGEAIYIVVEPEDIPNLVGDIFRANTTAEDVFDEYVVERSIGEKPD
jgi:hypothetical protein